MSVFRFAPSPNGYLHLGHAYSALFGYEAARFSGGRFLLRIEDIDRQRCRPEFEKATLEEMEVEHAKALREYARSKRGIEERERERLVDAPRDRRRRTGAVPPADRPAR